MIERNWKEQRRVLSLLVEAFFRRRDAYEESIMEYIDRLGTLNGHSSDPSEQEEAAN